MVQSLPRQIDLVQPPPHGQVDISCIAHEAGIETYKLTYSSTQSIQPGSFTLRWKLPCLGVCGVWKSGSLHHKRLQYDWEKEHLQSRISVDAPVVNVFGHHDQNIITFACQDAINLVEMNALLREEDNQLYCHISFFKERHPELTSYQTTFRIDTRSIPYYAALQSVSSWWSAHEELRPARVPELAREPLYSTWYNYHQDLVPETILSELSSARELGYRFVILDDGWQTRDSNRGYDYTGDWEPERIPDLAGFVEQIHGLGYKAGIWFSVPFCGKKSKAYQRFKGKFLTENHRWAPVFDPRYPEVRAYLIETYTNAVSTYKLDALKLDFIDDFRVYPETDLEAGNGKDLSNVNEAVYRLMTGVIESVKAINPSIAIEFRQQYIGPAMRKFGHMFRAFDCPNDPVSNRIRIADVKLLCGDSIVHSDPISWHPEESVELAALQLLNGLFGVPQLSVEVLKLSAAHREMVAFYTSYWQAHQAILLDGQFSPREPLANYPLMHSAKEDHHIMTLHSAQLVRVPEGKRIDVFNGTSTPRLYLDLRENLRPFAFSIYSCQGHLITTGNTSQASDIQSFEVPQSGYIHLNSPS